MNLLLEKNILRETIEEIWAHFPQEYFIQHTTEEMLWHIECITKYKNPSLPLIFVRQDKARGSIAIFIYGPVQLHQFSMTTACLEKVGVNVVDARIITTSGQYTLDTYLVLEQNYNTIHDNQRLNEIQHALQQALTKDSISDITVHRHMPRQHKHFDVNTEISFSLDKNNQRTIIEMTTADRPGLLSRIGKAFRECDVILQKAKIATIGVRIEDVFYITNKNHQPLDNEEFLQLRDSIIEHLNK